MNKEPNFSQNYFSTSSLVQFSDNIKRLFMNSPMANIEIHNWSKWRERMYGMIIHKVNAYIIPSSHPGLRNHCGREGRKISRERCEALQENSFFWICQDLQQLLISAQDLYRVKHFGMSFYT